MGVICDHLGPVAAHPRGRGEHEVVQQSRRAAGRLIPAGAGNMSPSPREPRRGVAHPRGRGEHTNEMHAVGYTAGSSPRARGTFRSDRRSEGPPGLIPAGAGNMVLAGSPFSPWWAHPRGRGEHGGVFPQDHNAAGSSPRARGTWPDGGRRQGGVVAHPRGRGEHAPFPSSVCWWAWLIPAGAGNMSSDPTSRRPRPAHPRGRGEHDAGTVD